VHGSPITPRAIAVVAGLEREQVIPDLRYRMQAIPTTFDDGEKGCTARGVLPEKRSAVLTQETSQ